MTSFFLWYFAISLVGLLALPLAYRLFPALADRGYSLSRALGLLLWGFVFWLSASFGLVQNNPGGLLFGLAVLGGLSAWALWQPGGFTELRAWLKAHWRTIVSVEVLFLLAFAFLAFVRANNPENVGTEKPMEMAFINAILRSPSFPPHDPWLSGYAISYYYFGYVLAAMLAKLTATSGGVAFNLMISLVFGLSAIGAYGLLYNLLSAYMRSKSDAAETENRTPWALFGAFLSPLFLLLVSNVEGFLELLRAYGVGWGSPTNNFWTWLNIKDLNVAPDQPYGWDPRFWFWWRASRVIQDYDLQGNFVEVIDEFPFFSYLLGDLHPHVLAMPFGILALALALNLYLGGWQGEFNLRWFKIPVKPQGFALLAVVLGGLAFLNTWDFPVYLAVACGALILSLADERGWGWDLAEEFVKFAIPLGLVSILLYLPFYVTFASQAGGILPNVIFPSRGAHLWVMFGTLWVPIFLFLGFLVGRRQVRWTLGLGLAFGLTAFLWLFSVALGLVAAQTALGASFVTSQGATSAAEVLAEATVRRFQYIGGLLTLVILIGWALAYITAKTDEAELVPAEGRNPLPFVLLLVLLGGLLVIAPEFVYLRDQFGSRMNTVFKFYYQAWALWSAAAAFGFVVMLRELRGLKVIGFGLTMTAVLLVGLTYPLLALPEKTNDFSAADPSMRTLDGAAYLELYNPDDWAAIQWLSQAPLGVVVEAVGGQYSDYARIATYSGQPNVLGWPGHEGQWRGGYEEQGSRQEDIEMIYTTSSWNETELLLKRYGIRYIYIGGLERSTYPVNEDKFAARLEEVYRQGQVVIYQVP